MFTRRLATTVAALVITLGLSAQNFTSSTLPIVVIETDYDSSTGNRIAIPDEPKVGATMRILYVNDTTVNYLSNQNNPAYLNYNGRIGIELRGSTSQEHNKKPYGFETRFEDDSTNNNMSLMGLPPENDWVLNAMNDDNSYLRDCLSYILGARLGHYSPRVRYCEVVVNGDYRGVYFLTEKIKIDDYRLDLAEMDSTDTAGAALTGGYIIKADKTTGGDPVAWTTSAHNYWEDVKYIHHAPKPELATPEQTAYIHAYFDQLQAVMNSANWSVADGYPSLIDIPSFVDYMIMGELTSNVDIYQKSTFFHKDRLGKLCAGPLWDFNLSYGNDLGSTPGRSRYDVWQFDNDDNTGSDFWYQLFMEPHFRCQIARRWYELTSPGGMLCYDSVCAVIDSLHDVASAAIQRDKQRWYNWNSTTNNINQMKQWLQNRYNWINSQLTDTSSFTIVTPPNLVISRINYHPMERGPYSEKDLEFIGITNADTMAVDATGVYFSLLGLSYQFPAGSILGPGEEVYIVADTDAFRTVYRERPYGYFARHLSNNSQRLLMTDTWGNIIDDVTYRDNTPWPQLADGHGWFLTLNDPLADNSLPENWHLDTVLHYATIHLRDTISHFTFLHSRDTILLGDTLVAIDSLFIVDSTILFDTIIIGPEIAISIDTLVDIDTLVSIDTIPPTPEAISEITSLSLEVYPTPTNGVITVICSETIRTLSVYSIEGRRLREWQPNTEHATADLKTLPDGIYLISILTDSGTRQKRVVKIL